MLHGRWLTRALQAPAGRLPRIPTRRMSEGGFGPMMRTVEGRDYAEFWWETALLRLDVLDTDEPAD
ncbi:MAG: hypothetical protein SFZ24_13050 [Planctomycetota bacterium]|nr:hypothetical protein [Planctomycetota bacterium]